MFSINVQFDLKGVKKGEINDAATGKIIEFYHAVTLDRQNISISKKLYDAFKDGSYRDMNLGVVQKEKGGLKFVDLDDWGDLEEIDF